MNKVLSQNEVDALLSAVSNNAEEVSNEALAKISSENIKNESDVEEDSVFTYDLTSQDRIIRGRFPQLDIIYEKFMRSFRVSVSSALRKIAQVNHASTDFVKFGDFINALPIPTSMSVLRFNALGGSALFVIESKLAYSLVDSFLGGTDRPCNVDGKDFTPIEMSIVKKVVELAINDLESAWESVEPIKCSFVRTEVNPQFVGIVPPTEIVIASTFDVELESATGLVSVVIPYSTLEPIKQKLSSGFQIETEQTDETSWSNMIKEQLLDTEVQVRVPLGQADIMMADLMKLKEGDVLLLDQESNGELDVLVEENKKFKAYHGVHHGAVAVQITQTINKGGKNV